MKNILLLLTLMPCITFGQTTAIPDANFENVLISQGYDTGLADGHVPTANIENIEWLDVSNSSIGDLTGIEYFINLRHLICSNNQLTNLDISQNTLLRSLFCHHNLLTQIDVSNCPLLDCFDCRDNQLEVLDVSNNPDLVCFDCSNNQLICLNAKNYQKNKFNLFKTLNNPLLFCIEIYPPDNAWGSIPYIDAGVVLSADCQNECSNTTGIEEQIASFNIYPNPTTGILTIEGIEGNTELYSIHGELVTTTNTQTMYISHVPSGVYFLRTTDSQGDVYAQKVVKE